MNDANRLALLRDAIRSLQATKQGYVQWAEEGKTGPHWKAAMRGLRKLEDDLEPDPVPALGPTYRGGKSVLNQQLTHNTDGIPLYPAYDDAFSQGREVIAPENMVVTDDSSSNPGLAFYTTGQSKLRYWFGHLDRTHRAGRRFVKGEVIGRVARNTVGGGPHCHIGINAEAILGTGRQLKYGANGNGPDYTFGSPTVGAQLRAADL